MDVTLLRIWCKVGLKCVRCCQFNGKCVCVYKNTLSKQWHANVCSIMLVKTTQYKSSGISSANLLRALEIFELPLAISPELNKCSGSNPVACTDALCRHVHSWSRRKFKWNFNHWHHVHCYSILSHFENGCDVIMCLYKCTPMFWSHLSIYPHGLKSNRGYCDSEFLLYVIEWIGIPNGHCPKRVLSQFFFLKGFYSKRSFYEHASLYMKVH